MAPNKTRKLRLPKFIATVDGIQKWHNSLVEKLGWVVLADAKGYHDKISHYKNSIHRLINTIKHLITEYESKNRKHDLNVMLMNIEVLKEHVAKVF